MTDNIIRDFREYAHAAHDSIEQKRKYTGAPYWVHTDEVAEIVASVTSDPSIICIAHGHDILEDVTPKNPAYSYESIFGLYGERIANGIFDLTDQYTSENYPTWNRKLRKLKERERLGAITEDSKLVKLADLISNTQDIVVNDPNFAVTYLREKAALLPQLFVANDQRNMLLWNRAQAAYNKGMKDLGL